MILLLIKIKEDLKFVKSLCVDEKYNLYVGFENGRINVYKYLKKMCRYFIDLNKYMFLKRN